jgi:hypothetical protein
MGKTIGGTRIGKRNIDVIPQGGKPIGELGSIADIPDRRVRLQVQEGISRFEAVYGVQTREVKTAEMDGVYGVAFIGGPREGTVVLDLKSHGNAKKLIADKMREYANGFKVKTNAPMKHTVIHELGHITWNSLKEKRGGKWEAAGKELRQLYSTFRKETLAGKNPFSSYGTTNIDEFFAEGITGSIIGTKQTQRNKFVKGIRRIVKKYKL